MTDSERQQLITDLTRLSQRVHETLKDAQTGEMAELKATAAKVDSSLDELLSSSADPIKQEIAKLREQSRNTAS